MEFSHDCDPTPRAPPIRPFGAFSGSGKLLGAGSGARGEDFHTRQQLPAWEDSIRCEVCSQKVAIHMIEAHLRTHDKSSKSLKSDQDVEYEQSVMNDIQRQSELEATRQKELKEQQDAKEAAELKEVLQKSILASNIGILESLLILGLLFSSLSLTFHYVQRLASKLLHFYSQSQVQNTMVTKLSLSFPFQKEPN